MLVEAISELKPCPFCGCDIIHVQKVKMSFDEEFDMDLDEYWYGCWCDNCFSCTDDYLNQEDAENAWNTRVNNEVQ